MQYQLKRMKRSRSIKVRVEPSGIVLVTAPYLAPKFLIERFVNQNETWIGRQQKRTKLKQDIYPTLDWDKKLVSFKGNLYSLRVCQDEARIKISHQELLISPVTGLEKDARLMLVRWLKRESEAYIKKRLPTLATQMDLEYETVQFRQQKSRWGSCSGRGSLSFNWRLIHFLPQVIDYVLIHELSHIKHHDHSTRFWELVEKYDMDYKKHRQFLRRQVVTLA